MKKKLLIISLIIAFFSGFSSDSLAADRGYFLCINSYTDAPSWSNRMLYAVTQYAQESHMSLSIEHMEMLLMDNKEDLLQFSDYIHKRYGDEKPKVLILLGNMAYNLRDEYMKMWGDIPIILYSSIDYTRKDVFNLKSELISPDDFVSISDLSDKYNTTMFLNNLFIKENLDYINQRIPGMDTLIFINDTRQVNLEIRKEIETFMAVYYPHQTLISITPLDMDTNELLERLNGINPLNTGILFSSWFYIRTTGGRRNVVSNTSALINTCRYPIFTLGVEDLVSYDGKMHSGVTYDFGEFKEALFKTLDLIMDGTQPRYIPFYDSKEGKTYLRCDDAISKGLHISDFPSDVILINRPVSFYTKYKFWILGLISFLIIFILVLTYRLRIVRMNSKVAAKDNLFLERIRKKFDSMPIGYLEVKAIYNDKGRVTDCICLKVNKMYKSLSEGSDDVVYKMLSECKDGPITCSLLRFFQASAKEEQMVSTYFFDKNSEKWFYLTIVPGDRKGYFDVFLVDSTELMLLKKKAEEANRLKSSFLANISHEIRTPLNAIVGFSSILAETDDEDEKQHFIDIIHSNNELLLRLINDILDISRIESGSIEIMKTTFDMSELIDGIYTTICGKCTNPDIKITCNNPYLHCVVNTDKNRVNQIMMNYLNNSFKYTKKGFIEIGYSYKDKGIEIYVKDTGVGIQESKKALLFNRFQKIDEYTQGSGLGLSICKAIADVMGGKVWFESEYGEGSVFLAWIPCKGEVKIEERRG